MSQAAAVSLQKHASAPTMETAKANATLFSYVKADGTFSEDVFPALAEKNDEIAKTLANRKSLAELPENQRGVLRAAVYSLSETIGKLSKTHKLSDGESAVLTPYKTALDKTTKFIPVWVKFACGVSLGTRHDDRLETHRRDCRRKNRQKPFDLRARRLRRNGRDDHHWIGRYIRFAGEHHACALLRRGGRNGREQIRPSNGNLAQLASRMGAHFASLRLSGRRILRRRTAVTWRASLA